MVGIGTTRIWIAGFSLAALMVHACACSQPPEPQPAVRTDPAVPAVQVGPAATVSPAGLVAPRSWIDAPLHGSTLMLAPIQVVSHSTHPNGVSQVELSVDGAVVATEESPNPGRALVTQRLLWKPGSPGKHTITLRAKNAAGIWGASASAEVTVKAIEAARASGPPPPVESPSATPTSTPAVVATATPSATPGRSMPPVQAPTDTPAPVATNTPLPVPSDTPVPPRAPTDTPAPSRLPTDTPMPVRVPTDTPVPVLPPTFTPTPAAPPLPAITLVPRLPLLPTATPLPKLSFGTPSVSASKLYWEGSICGPRDLTVSVEASNATGVKVFYGIPGQRVASAEMASQRGVWTKTINATDVPGYNSTASAPVQIYFIAINDAGQTQSQSYGNLVTLSRCIQLR